MTATWSRAASRNIAERQIARSCFGTASLTPPPLRAAGLRGSGQKHTFEQDVSLHINPGFIAWVTATAPIFRDTGDFTLKLGNTTWNLGGVYFDTPDPDRSGQYVADDTKLTPKKYKEACNHQPPSLVKVPVSYIPASTAVRQAPR